MRNLPQKSGREVSVESWYRYAHPLPWLSVNTVLSVPVVQHAERRRNETNTIGGGEMQGGSGPRLASLAEPSLAISPVRSSFPHPSHHGTIVNIILLCARLSSAYSSIRGLSHRMARGFAPTASSRPPQTRRTRLHRRLATVKTTKSCSHGRSSWDASKEACAASRIIKISTMREPIAAEPA
jgi:hypothetical protein